jgi:hypothetical protein
MITSPLPDEDDVATAAASLSKRSKSIGGFKPFKAFNRCAPFKTLQITAVQSLEALARSKQTETSSD